MTLASHQDLPFSIFQKKGKLFIRVSFTCGLSVGHLNFHVHLYIYIYMAWLLGSSCLILSSTFMSLSYTLDRHKTF